MARNGFFGVRNSHFAICTDEDKFTYEKPVHMAGTVEISMEPSVETAPAMRTTKFGWKSSRTTAAAAQ